VDSQHLASGSNDGTIIIWKLLTGQPVRALKGHTGWVTSLDWSPDHRTLASGSDDGSIRTWDALAGKPMQTWREGDAGILSVHFSADGHRLVSTSYNESIRVWDVDAATVVLQLRHNSWSAVLCPSGRQLASAGVDGTARLWDAQTCQELLQYQWPTTTVQDVKFDGQTRLVFASHDGSVTIRDPATGFELAGSQGHEAAPRATALSQDGSCLAVGGPAHTILVCTTSTGSRLASCQGQDAAVRSLALDAHGAVLASGNRDGLIKIWDPFTGTEVHSWNAGASSIELLVMAPDGTHLASVADGRTVSLWQLAPVRPVGTIDVGPGTASAIVYSPDGTRIAIGTAEDVRICDAVDGRQILRISQMSKLSPRRLAFTPDGRRLAMANCDRVKIWDCHTGRELLSLPCHHGCVSMLAFDASGQRLAGADPDGILYVWDASPMDSAALIHRDALGEVRFLEHVGLDGVALSSTLQKDETLGDDVRVEALAIAKLGSRTQTQEESRRVVQACFAKPLFRYEVLTKLESDSSLSPAVRREAIALAQVFPEQPDCLSHDSFQTTLAGQDTQQHYRRALEEANVACRLDPDKGINWMALGAAQYRMGLFDEAIATLTKSYEASQRDPDSCPLFDVAFLAMSQAQKGCGAEAKKSLEQFRELLESPRWSRSARLRILGREVEETLQRRAK
jgi:WD40 repeat protein